jgi:hypothetical protein
VRSYLEKPFTKIGLVEWLKVKAMSSSPSTEKDKKKKKKKQKMGKSQQTPMTTRKSLGITLKTYIQ